MSRNDTDIEASSAPLIEHLIELRTRLMWSLGGFLVAFILCFFFAKPIFNFLVVPYQTATEWAGVHNKQVELIYTAPQEFFFTQVKIAAFGGFFTKGGRPTAAPPFRDTLMDGCLEAG